MQPANYFYTPVEYLFCRHIVSGYSNGDGTSSYRPGNNTTRAQLAKLLGRGGGSDQLAQGKLTKPAPEAFQELEASLR